MLRVPKLLLVVAAALYAPVGIEDPDIGRLYNGKIVGLVDTVRHEIIPQNYCRIDYLGHGLYLAWGRNKQNPLSYGSDRFLFNRDGLAIETVVPAEGKFVQICWFGADADAHPDKRLDCLPEDAILRFRKNGKFGLCDIHGKVLLEAIYDTIDTAHKGICTVTKKPSKAEAHYNSQFFYCRKRELKESFDEPREFQTQTAASKKDEINQPADLDVEPFYGDFAIARKHNNGFTKCGIVNRNYQFVIKPNYQYLTPVFTKAEQGLLDDPMAKYLRPPDYFKAVEGHNEKLLSTKGAVLYVAPEGYMIDSVHANTVYCHSPRRMMNNEPAGKEFSLAPAFTDALSKDDLRRHWGQFQEEGPDRFLIERSADDGLFNSVYWRSAQDSPVSKLEMFSRFLKQYNLIGMSRSELKTLLIPEYLACETGNKYNITMDRGCGFGSSLIINLKDDKVISFGISDNNWGHGQPSQLITRNSLLDLKRHVRPANPLQPFQFLPK